MPEETNLASDRRRRLLLRREWEESVQAKAEKINAVLSAKKVKYFEVDDETIQKHLMSKHKKLLKDKDFVSAINIALNHIHHRPVRPIKDWRPKGKGRQTLFVSLINHLTAKYSIPPFMAYTFYDRCNVNNPCIHNIIIKLAAGESAFKVLGVYFPLTRKMAHDFVSAPGDFDFMRAVRYAQLKNYGNHNLINEVINSPYFNTFWGGKRVETFKATVLQWLCNQAMLNPDQVGPMIDYLMFRYNGDNNFSMKGRSTLAIIRAMEDWHTNSVKGYKGNKSYIRSGFRPFFHEKIEHFFPVEKCEIKEILSTRDLVAESKAMSHCVWTYEWRVLNRSTSIWSMMVDDQRALTIEVDNVGRSIVQARGKRNRRATQLEERYLARWAAQEGFKFGLYY